MYVIHWLRHGAAMASLVWLCIHVLTNVSSVYSKPLVHGQSEHIL